MCFLIKSGDFMVVAKVQIGRRILSPVVGFVDTRSQDDHELNRSGLGG